jgi:hypothetical protein
MNINALYTYINKNFIISENLRPLEVEGYTQSVIDDINDRLQANFPLLSEWPDFVAAYNAANPTLTQLDPQVYTAFPARYLRKVLGTGAALNFMTNDEEGESVAEKYYLQYETALATMVRDYHALVPIEFQNNTGGFVTNSYNSAEDVDASIEGIVISNGEY